MDDLTKQQDTSSILCRALCIATNPLVNSNWSYSPEMFNSVQNQWCLLSRVTLKFDGWLLKKNRAPLLYYVKLCASFQSHGWIQAGVTVWKHSIRVKSAIFFAPCDFEISILYQALPIISKPSMNSNLSYRPESLNLAQNQQFFARVTFKFDGRPWRQYAISSILHQALYIISKTLVNSNWNYCPKTLNSGQNLWFLSLVTLKIDGWPWNTIGHLFYAASSFVHHFVANGKFKLRLQSGDARFGSQSTNE